LQAAGASKGAHTWYGYEPQIKPAFWSLVLPGRDIDVRESAMLGLVGAGRIGMVMDAAQNIFQWDRVAMVPVAIFAAAAKNGITRIRKRIR
jgi:phosphonate transport system permease protein